ncbi:helix-turn-helix domain-containing protein [Actinoallomurus sp. CA-142502]|uniref:helix-turn-helix domain-containing protein n=1 Tax=Actinoallomurus sp. CA-142502 TaxID=3239885 RepID=UPI003D93E925
MAASRDPSPTLRRRRLTSRLRDLRAASGMSAAEVASRLGWDKNKPLYLESGQAKRPDPHDMERLAELYGVSDEQRQELVELAKAARQKGWWHPYSTMLSRTFTTLIGLEAEADEVCGFEPSAVPGLLQTEAYAGALIAAGGPSNMPAEDVAARVEVRRERQRILHRPDAPARLSVIVDEAAVHRIVGGPEVMRAQMEHLIELMELPNITIGVLPFRAGAHPGVAGSFMILQFADAADAPAVYVETIAGELFIEDETDVAVYSNAFETLRGKALNRLDTIAVITAAAATM